MDDVVVTGKLKLKKKGGGVTKKHVKHAEFPSWANYAVEIAQQAVNPSKYKPAPIANRSAADVEATASSFAAPHERKKTKAELDKEKSDTNAKRVLKKVSKSHERRIDELNWQLEDTPIFNELPRINPIKETGY